MAEDTDGIMLSSGILLTERDLEEIDNWLTRRSRRHKAIKRDAEAQACAEAFPGYPIDETVDSRALRALRVSFYKEGGLDARAANAVRDIFPTRLVTMKREEVVGVIRNVGPLSWSDIEKWQQRNKGKIP